MERSILLLWEKYEWKIIISTLYSIFIVSYIVFKYDSLKISRICQEVERKPRGEETVEKLVIAQLFTRVPAAL